MPLPPPIVKGLRIALVLLGAMAIMSAIVNGIATLKLFEPGDETAFGFSRNQMLVQYAVQVVLGAAMIYFGLRRRKT